jgi:hypothetical protein
MEAARDELARRLFERAERQRGGESRQPSSTSALASSPSDPRASSIWDRTWTLLDPRPLDPQGLRAPEPSRQAALPELDVPLPPPVSVPIIPPAAPERLAESSPPRPAPDAAPAPERRAQTRTVARTKGRVIGSRLAKPTQARRRNWARAGGARPAPARTFGDVFRTVGRGMGEGLSCIARNNCSSPRQAVGGALGIVTGAVVGAGVAGGPGAVTGSIAGVAASAPRKASGAPSRPLHARQP